MGYIVFLVEFFNFLIIINGVHFLGGTITWHPLDKSATGTPVAIVITQTYSWLYSRITCTQAMIAANQLIPVGIYRNLLTETLNCITNCGNGSLGYVAPTIVAYCTDISAPIGTTVSQRSDTVYLEEGDDFSAAFQLTGWRALATYSGSAPWSISTHLIAKPRSDNGLYNSAPVATVMSPIYIPVNVSTVINIPVADADGDSIRCRWSVHGTVDECGGVCPPGSLPSNSTIYPNCTIVIFGQNLGDWYAVAVMVEDFVSTSSTSPLSSVPVQFLLQIVGSPPCSIAPKIIGDPREQSCTVVVVGEIFTSKLIAMNYCDENVTIVDIATLSFPGMVKGNITELNETIYYTTISWTPTMAQLGYQVMCAMAFNSENSQSAQYCFKFFVSATSICSCPGDACFITTTINTNHKSDFNYWPVIGGIMVLTLLGAIALSYLWCRCCWLANGARNRRKYTGICEFYHIERCIDPDCRSQNKFNSPVGAFLSSMNENENNIFDKNISSLTKTQNSSSGKTIVFDYNVIIMETNAKVEEDLPTNEKIKSSEMHPSLMKTPHLCTIQENIVDSTYYNPFKQTSNTIECTSSVEHINIVHQQKSLVSNTNSSIRLLKISHIKYTRAEKKAKSNKTAKSLHVIVKTRSKKNKH